MIGNVGFPAYPILKLMAKLSPVFGILVSWSHLNILTYESKRYQEDWGTVFMTHLILVLNLWRTPGKYISYLEFNELQQEFENGQLNEEDLGEEVATEEPTESEML